MFCAGYSVDMLGQTKEAMAGCLQGDTAAISPQRCISLYLERLGAISPASHHRLKVQSSRCVFGHCKAPRCTPAQ